MPWHFTIVKMCVHEEYHLVLIFKDQKQNGVHVGTYTPLLQLLIQNILTYFSLVF
jgi:hypothetical protein